MQTVGHPCAVMYCCLVSFHQWHSKASAQTAACLRNFSTLSTMMIVMTLKQNTTSSVQFACTHIHIHNEHAILQNAQNSTWKSDAMHVHGQHDIAVFLKLRARMYYSSARLLRRLPVHTMGVMQTGDIWSRRGLLAPHWEAGLEVKHPEVAFTLPNVAQSALLVMHCRIAPIAK